MTGFCLLRSDLEISLHNALPTTKPSAFFKAEIVSRVIPKPIKYMGYEKSCRQGTVTVGKVTTTATVTLNSNTIVVASAAGLVAGMKLVLSNFPSSTQTIISVNSLSVTLDAAATASATNVVVRSEQMRVTGDKTNFPQDCIGAFIRFGALGMEADSIGSNVPFVMERRIENWNSTTSLAISSTGIYQRPGVDGEPIEGITFDANEVDKMW